MRDLIEISRSESETKRQGVRMTEREKEQTIRELKKEMEQAAKMLEFEYAAILRDRIVKLGKSYCYGIIENLLTPSEHRTEQDCPVYKQCGGCSFRHFSYEEECRLKNSFVKEAFKRIGGLEPEFEPFVGAENISHYRNKAQYPVAEQNGKVVCGFYAKRSHRVCMNLDCNLQPEIFASIVTDIMDYVNAEHIKAYNEEQGTGLLRHIYLRRGEHSGQIMLCLIVTDISVCSCFDTLFKLLSEKYSDIKSIVLNGCDRRGKSIGVAVAIAGIQNEICL